MLRSCFRRMALLGAGILLALMSFILPAAEKTELRGVGQFEIPAWFKNSFLDLPEDVAEATQSGKRLMLYFGQEGCPYCAELFNKNFSQAHIVDYTRQHFDAIDFDLWGNREVTDLSGKSMPEKELAAKLKVWFTPTLLFFNEQGEQVLRINGYYPPHQFLAALKYVGEKQEKRLTFKEYLAKLSPPPAKGALQPQPFFARPPHDLTRVPGGKPLAVFFEQKDCTGCDRMHEVVLKDAVTMDFLKRYHVIQLDRWGDMPVVTPAGHKTNARAWADSLNVAYVPTAVLYDGGKEVIRIEGMLKGFHVQSVLDYVVSGAYKTQPSLQRFIQARADYLREQGVVVDIWN
ncbi:MAG: thioredoxin fold domain-containing protein [Sulfuricaulis sp.]|uniref:thioredoxin family protein n=1 Tax=Sulfuricaulis sp. TaxID=2003553 RepID=UPI0025F01B60|nr:thioredoxin fold domain-containing protein [Sulfuricaulis sp.]MCR4348144.1 thioredoxin fold domain-containing protein [Sulfuricaulis sp.]